MNDILKIKGLKKSYGDLLALDDFNLNVKEGEILGLLGPNGSGKSTCINTVLSLLKYDEGSIKIFGEEMTPTSYDIKKKIGVVFQDVAVFEELTVYENIDYFCGLYIKDKEKRTKYIDDALSLVSLHEFKKFKPKQLSGGLLRRLNIACGVAHKPRLIFLDEPTVAVDPQSRNNILEGIKKLNNEGATIIYTTHYMEEVEQLCDRIVIVDKGKIIASGTNEELKSSIHMGERIIVDIQNISKNLIEDIFKLSNVSAVEIKDNEIYISYRTREHNLISLIEFFKEKNIQYESVFSERPSLNDVFLELTGKALRD